MNSDENLIEIASARCLHQFYLLGSGGSQSHDSLASSHEYLIAYLQDFRVLDSICDTGEVWENPTDSPSPETLSYSWLLWQKKEQVKRLAWASFACDCTLTALTGRRGIVELSQLPKRMPCSEEIWEASTPAAWKSLSKTRPHLAKGALFSCCARSVIAGNAAPDDLSIFGKKLTAQFISRLLWDVKLSQSVERSHGFELGLEFLSDAHSRTKSRLLRGLDGLRKSLSSPSTVTGLIHHKYD